MVYPDLEFPMKEVQYMPHAFHKHISFCIAIKSIMKNEYKVRSKCHYDYIHKRVTIVWAKLNAQTDCMYI